MKRPLASLLSGIGILVAAGCNDSREPTNLEHASLVFADSSGSISGNIVNADSLPVRSRVLVYLIGAIPPDTTPPDTVPPDSVPPDSVPPDTTSGSSPAYTLPVALFRGDSVPGDSTPPPPLPCGNRGQLVARTESDRNGLFRVRGLAPGIYDIRAEARGRLGTVCGAVLRGGQSLFVTIIVTARNAAL